MLLMVAAAPALAQEKGKGKGGKNDKATPETGGTLAGTSVLALEPAYCWSAAAWWFVGAFDK